MRETMTIGEFARCTGLSVSALRFYANRGVLEPAEIDRHTGYRRYDPDQVADGRLIRDLRRLDMSLVEITRALQLTERARQDLVADHLLRLERIVERARAVAHTMQPEPIMRETPTMPTPTVHTATLPAAALADAVAQILPAAGTDPEFPHLMGVLIEGRDGSIRLAATDRHRLAIRDLVPSSLTEDFSTVVAAATLDRWRPSLSVTTELSVTMDQRNLVVTGTGVDLMAARLPTTFPDYEPFLAPKDGATTVQTDRGALLGAVHELASDETPIEMTVDGTSIQLARGDQDHRIGASVDGPSKRVGINPRFLADALEHAVGPEVTIEVTTPLDPVMVRSADDGTFVSMIMPYLVD